MTNVPRRQLPGVVHQIKQPIEREVAPEKAAEVLAATYVLMGLRYDQAVVAALKREVVRMEEAITYQEIVGIGEIREARKLILRQGKNRFGRGSRKAEQFLAGITDLTELEAQFDRLSRANSWDEFLGPR